MSNPQPTPSIDRSGIDPAGRCAVCAHELSTHDATGRRFCQATQSQALSRNCVCR